MFFSNGSYAVASISDWGFNEANNDLTAWTYAYNTFGFENYAIQARAGVYITFDDYSSASGVNMTNPIANSNLVSVVKTGAEYDDFDHCVIGFETSHEIWKFTLVNGVLSGGASQYEDTIVIRTPSGN